MKTITIIKKHITHFMKKCYRDNVSALSGQSAFFLILSAPPMLLFIFSMVFILTGTQPQDIQLPDLKIVDFPAIEYISRFIEQSVQSVGTGTAIVTAVTALWSAGKGLYCITEGISRIYELPNRRLWVTKRLLSMGYTVIMLIALLLAVALLAANIVFTDSITELVGGNDHVRRLVFVAFYLVYDFLLALVMSLAVKLYLRSRVKNKRWLTIRALMPGMLLTVLAWNLLTVGVSFYIRHFAASSIYGSLASVFILMMWIYFLMVILLYGVQLNYIYRAQFSVFCLSKKRREALREAVEKKKSKNLPAVSDK